MRLFEGIRRMLTLRRRRREEQDARLRSFVTRARIESIRARAAASSEEYRARTAMIPTFDPVVPVAFFDPYKRDDVVVPAPWKGEGGQSGGAGASASWEAPDKNCFTRPDGECVSSQPCMHDSPPSSDPSPSSSCDSGGSGGGGGE